MAEHHSRKCMEAHNIPCICEVENSQDCPRCDDGQVFDSHDIYDPGKPCPTCEGRGTIPKRQPALSP